MRIASLFTSAALLLSTPSSAQSSDQGGLQPPSAFDGISDQAARSRALFTEVAKVLTHPRCIEREATLDRQFADRTITTETLATITGHMGELQGRLRAAHLKYHLATAALLTSEQAQRYDELRGYR